MKAPPHALEILQALQAFGLSHSDPDTTTFHDALQNWGDQWIPLEPRLLPATKNLKRGIETASPETRGLIELFDQHKSLLYWEQTYSKKDAFISEAMLADYGYAELIGTRGPFVSDRIRCGVGIYGANITYPMHWHLAEEIYIPLSGGARYTIGDKPETRHGPGEVVFVKSNTPHEFSTDDEALVVFYLWQAGDLRQVSEFSNA